MSGSEIVRLVDSSAKAPGQTASFEQFGYLAYGELYVAVDDDPEGGQGIYTGAVAADLTVRLADTSTVVPG